MLEIVIYTASGLILYALSDWILRKLEAIHGELLPYRSLIFFVIIFVLALSLFQIIKLFFTPG
jgi:hypothetical protein